MFLDFFFDYNLIFFDCQDIRLIFLDNIAMNNRIKALRIESGLTQKELAEKIGSTSKNIWAYENGNVKPPYDVLISYAKYFDVTTDYLLGLEDDFGHKDEVIRRPPYEVTDKSLQNIIKLFGVMSELQKAHVLGYVVAYLEREGVNVGKVLGY